MKKLIPLVPLLTPVITLFILFFLFKYGNDQDMRSITLKGCFLSLFKSIFDFKIWTKLYFTLFIALKGIFGGLLAAIIFGCFVSFFPKVTKSFTYLLNGWRAIPLTLLIPFLTVFPTIFVLPFGFSHFHSFNRDPAILISIGAFQYLFLGILDGIDKRNIIREKYFISSQEYSRIWYVKKILIFEILPPFLYSLRLSILFSLVLAIVLEQLITYPGIGQFIYELSSTHGTFQAMQMIGLLTLVAYLGVFVDIFFKITSNYLLRWM